MEGTFKNISYLKIIWELAKFITRTIMVFGKITKIICYVLIVTCDYLFMYLKSISIFRTLFNCLNNNYNDFNEIRNKLKFISQKSKSSNTQ